MVGPNTSRLERPRTREVLGSDPSALESMDTLLSRASWDYATVLQGLGQILGKRSQVMGAPAARSGV